MKKETESWGQLTKNQFDKFLESFTKQFGKPKRKLRLAISFWDPKLNKNLDTRVRITNGKAELIQKYGKWMNRKKRSLHELILPLPRNPQRVYIAYKILSNNIQKSFPDKFLQFENYIYNQPNFELKLTHQFGKSSKYSFEVELKNKRETMKSILNRLGLTKLVTLTDVAFWNKWDRQVNFTTKDLTDNQIKALIKKYL